MVERGRDGKSIVDLFFWICGRSELRRSKEVKATRIASSDTRVETSSVQIDRLHTTTIVDDKLNNGSDETI